MIDDRPNDHLHPLMRPTSRHTNGNGTKSWFETDPSSPIGMYHILCLLFFRVYWLLMIDYLHPLMRPTMWHTNGNGRHRLGARYVFSSVCSFFLLSTLSCTIRVTPFPCVPMHSRSVSVVLSRSRYFRPLIITFRTSLRYSFTFPF